MTNEEQAAFRAAQRKVRNAAPVIPDGDLPWHVDPVTGQWTRTVNGTIERVGSGRPSTVDPSNLAGMSKALRDLANAAAEQVAKEIADLEERLRQPMTVPAPKPDPLATREDLKKLANDLDWVEEG